VTEYATEQLLYLKEPNLTLSSVYAKPAEKEPKPEVIKVPECVVTPK